MEGEEYMSNPRPNLLLLQILADYSNDLQTLSKRNGKLPAEAAVERIEALIDAEVREVYDNVFKLAYKYSKELDHCVDDQMINTGAFLLGLTDLQSRSTT